jgi:hypothetical protein
METAKQHNIMAYSRGGVSVLILPSASQLFANTAPGVSEEIIDVLHDKFHACKLIRIPYGKGGMIR